MKLIGKKMFFFVPDVNVDEQVIRSDFVIAEEFDAQDRTVKVRFLGGQLAHKFAVAETEEEIKKAIEKFEEYRKVYHECLEEIKPIDQRLKDKYEEMYGEVMDTDLAQMIIDRRNPNLIPEEHGEENVA